MLYIEYDFLLNLGLLIDFRSDCMGNRDFRNKETKKPKKDSKKIIIPGATISTPVPEVKVIKAKGKKNEEFPE
jgi:hypothetical protein